MKILFAYDGSPSADAAIAVAGNILGERNIEATVLTVWEPLVVEVLRATKFGGRFSVPTASPEVDHSSELQAQQLAESGAELARRRGFNADVLAVADDREIQDAIISHADELGVDLVVLGARGLSGLRAYTGSVSNHVLQHAHRPLLIIPATGESPMDNAFDETAASEAL